MNNLTKKILWTVAKVVIAVAAILLLWWLFAVIANNSLVLPTPWEVIKISIELLGKGETYLAVLFTLIRAVIAFAISLAVAVALALFVGVCGKAKNGVDNVVTFFRAVPTVAIILLAMIALRSTAVPVLVAFLVVFPVIYSAFTSQTDMQFDGLCKVYGVSAYKKVKYVLLPQIGKAVPTQCKDCLPLCIKIVIAGEVLALPRIGLGQEMYVAKVNLLTAKVLALTVLTLAVCYAISGIFALCQRRAK